MVVRVSDNPTKPQILDEEGWLPLPVELASFETIKTTVLDMDGNKPDLKQALLVCDEVLANIVNYSGADHLDFRCEMQPGTLLVSFSDDGTPFNPIAFPSVEREFELLDKGGMGLNIIRQNASGMKYERKDDRNVFTLSFDIAASS